ncbi:unnamed protein product [Prorocentrum cordatum]|uniref:Uncharacterized protein n=1 Tax=Prorocentrum cordatum TaxID=2364126 RepID=A0ABN9R740_9DINO|nr:unnamed protein product [Polarella glacialis]
MARRQRAGHGSAVTASANTGTFLWRNKGRQCGPAAPARALKALRFPGAAVPWDAAGDQRALGRWANGPPKAGEGRGTAPKESKDLVVEALREYQQSTGKDIAEIIEYQESKAKAVDQPPGPADLGSKPLHDLLARRSKKVKQAERKQLDEHEKYLVKIEAAIREAQAKSVPPEPSPEAETEDHLATVLAIKAFAKLLQRASRQYQLDFTEQVQWIGQKLEKVKSEAEKAASAARPPDPAAAGGAVDSARGGGADPDMGEVASDMEIDIEDPEVAKHFEDAGVTDVEWPSSDHWMGCCIRLPRNQSRGDRATVSAPLLGGQAGRIPARPEDRAVYRDASCLEIWGANVSKWSSGQGLLEWARNDRKTAEGGAKETPQVVCLQEHSLKCKSQVDSARRWMRQSG